MDSNITTTTPTTPQTVSRGQLEALKASIRAAAEGNPAGVPDKGRRCAEITRAVCFSFGVAKLAELPASSFSGAMKEASRLAKPERRQGHAERAVRTAAGRLAEALSDLRRAGETISGFRHEAETLIVPFKEALGVNNRAGVLAAHVQEGMGLLLSLPLLDIEEEIRRAQSTLQVLGTYLPSIGRALDELPPAPPHPTTMLSAFTLGAD